MVGEMQVPKKHYKKDNHFCRGIILQKWGSRLHESVILTFFLFEKVIFPGKSKSACWAAVQAKAAFSRYFQERHVNQTRFQNFIFWRMSQLILRFFKKQPSEIVFLCHKMVPKWLPKWWHVSCIFLTSIFGPRLKARAYFLRNVSCDIAVFKTPFFRISVKVERKMGPKKDRKSDWKN